MTPPRRLLGLLAALPAAALAGAPANAHGTPSPAGHGTLVPASAQGTPALPGARSHADGSPAPPIAIDIRSANGPAGVTYLISLRNNTEAPAPLVVLQRFARPPLALSASGEGKVDAGTAAWTLEIAPKDYGRVSSEAAFDDGTVALSTVCLADPATGRVLDCATGDPAAMDSSGFPLSTVLNGLSTVLIRLVPYAIVLACLYAVVSLRWWWWPRLARWASRHRNGLAVICAVLAIGAVTAGGFVLLAHRAEPLLALHTGSDKENVGWAGQPHALRLGHPGASRQAEFTVYQWSCGAQADTPICVAVVAVRNTTGAPVAWYSRMQRLYQRSGTWLEPDPQATVAVNGGADPFASPLGPGERRFASLLFKTPDPSALIRLDLREGAFAAGVSLNLD